jgi:hypothetical protein
MANGYSIGMVGMNLEPIMIPHGVINVIRVNETTPNLEMIQSFPVVSRNGNVHIHQDPVTSQMYEMTDEFHAMIPQILARNSNVTGNMMVGGGLTGGQMPSGVLIVGQNLSVSQLKDALPQPTVQINGVEFKQNPKKTSFKSEDGTNNIIETFNVFPESTSRGTTDINSLLYSQQSVNRSVNYFSRNGFPISSRFVIQSPKSSRSSESSINSISSNSSLQNRFVLPNTKSSTISSRQPTIPVVSAFTASNRFKTRYLLRIDKQYGKR